MSAFYSELENEGLLHIEGPDTLQFLQGQTTCDTRKLSATQAMPGAYCNPQGRMVCDFLLAQVGDEHVVLRMRKDILDTAAGVLGKYIAFSKAELEAGREDWAVFACWGEDSTMELSSLLGLLPSEQYEAMIIDGCAVVCTDAELPSYELYVDLSRRPELPDTLPMGMDEAEESDFRALQLRQGIARVESATTGEFLPQLFNYDLTDHVSFTKGCYTGQEIVARLHYRGKPKQRAYLLELQGSQALPAGSKLFTPGQEKSTGIVLNSAVEGDITLCLAAVSANGIAGGLRLEDDGAELTPLELPYSLPA